MTWLIFLLVAIPLLAVAAWVVMDDSFVRIEPGQLGLLLVHGKATDRALDPGPHWVPALRRRMVQIYPSLELSWRTGSGPASQDTALEQAGPPLRVVLGDRAVADVGYTLRFRLDPAMLRLIHDRFGPDGIWSVVRDETARTVRATLAAPGTGIDDLFGTARADLEARLGADVGGALAALGFIVTMFGLGDLDLGRTGDVIQATARARHELAREEAEAATRVARARIDADLAPHLTGAGTEAAIRYREVEAWQHLARVAGVVVEPGTAPPPAGPAERVEEAAPPAEATDGAP